jgi:hypothetical protein
LKDRGTRKGETATEKHRIRSGNGARRFEERAGTKSIRLLDWANKIILILITTTNITTTTSKPGLRTYQLLIYSFLPRAWRRGTLSTRTGWVVLS